MPPTRPKFRWRQFSLRTGVILFLLCCIAFGFAARWYHAIRSQAEAQRRLVLRSKSTNPRAGLQLEVRYEPEKTTPWLTRQLRRYVDPDAQRRIEFIGIGSYRLESLEFAPEIQNAYAIEHISLLSMTLNREAAEALLRAPGLQSIVIFCEEEGDSPALGFLNALPQARGLKSLTLKTPFVSRRAAETIARSAELVNITVYVCEPESVAILAAAPKVHALTVQSLQSARTNLADDAAPQPPAPQYANRLRRMFDALAENSHLVDLDITGPLPMNPFELDEFCRRSRIEFLSLRDCKMGGKLLEQVASMPHLKRLVIYDNELRDDDIGAIAAAKKLESLTIGPNISNAAIEALRKAMPKCTIGEW